MTHTDTPGRLEIGVDGSNIPLIKKKAAIFDWSSYTSLREMRSCDGNDLILYLHKTVTVVEKRQLFLQQ